MKICLYQVVMIALLSFGLKNNEWICSQTIPDHSSNVNQLSLNVQENQVISCGDDRQILVIEQLGYNKNWSVNQKIQVDCCGYRLCFINNNLFTFQPQNGNLMEVYEKSSATQQFTKSKDINVDYFHNNLLNRNNYF